MSMKKKEIIIGTAAAAALTSLIIYSYSKCNTHKRLKTVSNEGYETAHDILYPNKKRKKNKLKFGPVLP